VSPLAQLRAAILAEDWHAVHAAFAALTGEVLSETEPGPAPKAKRKPSPPEPMRVTPELTFHEAADLEAAVGLGGVVLPSLPVAQAAQPSGPKNFGQQVEAPPRFVNKFVPPKPSARELDIDRKLLSGVEPTERDREPDRTTDVQAVCGKCGRTYTAKSWEVDRRIAGDGGIETMVNRCPRC